MPCDERMDCSIGAPTVQSFSALNLAGMGPVNSDAALQACLADTYAAGYDDTPYFVQNALGVSAASLAAQTADVVTVLLPWNWVIVVPGDGRMALLQLEMCLAPQFASFTAAQVLAQSVPMRGLKVARPCGGVHWRWTSDGLCGCVPGYEETSFVVGGGTTTQCLPCLNGTARPDGAPACLPCAGPFEHAPYLGMTACACLPGYERVVVDGTNGTAPSCEPIPGYAALYGAPTWYTEWLAPYAVPVGAAVGTAALVFVLALLAMVY